MHARMNTGKKNVRRAVDEWLDESELMSFAIEDDKLVVRRRKLINDDENRKDSRQLLEE